VDGLSDFLAGRAPDLELDAAALVLAGIEYPTLDGAPYLRLLDSYATELAERLREGAPFVDAANEFLFEELGFTGNSADYHNPANSCLNDVILSRTGIPITLSVVYLEVARRLNQPVYGIGLPGHFVVEYDDGSYSTYIDVFHGGRLLDADGCYKLAGAPPDPTLLARVTKRQIIARMINNLRGVYLTRGAHQKSLRILNLLLELNPKAAEHYKLRGLTHLQLEHTRDARADLERYLQLAPAAPDRKAVETQLASLTRWMVGLN
jgi:regulator of sirC expression with transglutaminase-like and TPR domain